MGVASTLDLGVAWSWLGNRRHEGRDVWAELAGGGGAAASPERVAVLAELAC